MHAAIESIANCDLRSWLLQCLMHVHELSATLVDLVKFLAVDCRVKHQLLNPIAILCEHEIMNHTETNPKWARVVKIKKRLG